MERPERMFLSLYWGVAGLLFALFAWWIYYFSIQGSMIVKRVEEAGVQLSPEAIEAVRVATDRSQRMLLSEGSFLGLLLFAGLFLMLRAMRREVQMRQQQHDLVSAVTHELKSPIASARLHVESLQLGRVSAEKQPRYLENTRLDLQRLDSQVDRLLESARVTHGLPEPSIERFDLAEYVLNSAGRIAKREAGGNLELEIDAPNPVLVNADASALDTILRNLIANTVKYGGANGRMRVRVALDGSEALLEVRDFGPGLNGIAPKRAVRAFTRGGNDIVKSRPGVGLGLYLVEQLTRSLKGRLSAGNAREGHGFEVRIHLPLAGELQA